MSSKEIVQELLKKLPDEASLTDIAQEIEFVTHPKHQRAARRYLGRPES